MVCVLRVDRTDLIRSLFWWSCALTALREPTPNHLLTKLIDLTEDQPMRNISLSAFCAALALNVGCAQHSAPVEISDGSSPATATAKADNKNCPIMGHPVAEDGGSSTWNGKTIGYCCEGCKPKFEALSDDEKAAKLAKADATNHSGHEGHGDADSSIEDATEET